MSTHNIPFSQYKKENHPKSSQICNYQICFKGPNDGFETAVVKEPSMFEPLKFYCNNLMIYSLYISSSAECYHCHECLGYRDFFCTALTI